MPTMVTNRRARTLIKTTVARSQQIITRLRGSPIWARRDGIGDLALALISSRGEAGVLRLARNLVLEYEALPEPQRVDFLNMLASTLGPDESILAAAVAGYVRSPAPQTISVLRHAATSRREILFDRINLAEHGTEALMRMREDALRNKAKIMDFAALDTDFGTMFRAWFNSGFLELRRMEWSSPANILHKIISYEAVHEIGDWEELRRRLEPVDRRCYAFFHPRMLSEPLIFVEVALTREVPTAISMVLQEERTPASMRAVRTAVFYSISNCQTGLSGVPFGNFLIKRVVQLLQEELPQLRNFVTLSPVPGFAEWLRREMASADSILSPNERLALAPTQVPGWSAVDAADSVREALLTAAARHLVEARQRDGRIPNAVARFHLGNGAELKQINWLGDSSSNGLKTAHGLMVNYLYHPNHIERNYFRFASKGQVVASREVMRLIKR